MLRATKAFSDPAGMSLLCSRSSALWLNSRAALGTVRFQSSQTAAPDSSPQPNGRRGPPSSDRRYPTVMERIKSFPSGAKQLYSDVLRYKNIHDASRTPHNAWTVHRNPLYRGNYKLPFIIMDEELRPGRIPRREHEEQRRLKDDLRKVLPVIAIWAIPFIGYLPMLFAVVTPRQTLSRQFFNQYQRELYASIEYRQCQSHFCTLGEYVFSSAMISAKRLDISKLKEDAAGPVLDLMPFYVMFSDTLPEEQTKHFILPVGKLAHLESYPREHLISLALANGLYQHLPDSFSTMAARMCPWLKQEIRRIGNNIATDDTLLLEEAYDSNECQSMTDQEVMDASLMRGLPVTVSYDEMRVCLTHHLSMIRTLKERVPSEGHKPSQGLKLLTMHLSSIRYYLRKEH